MTDSQVHIHFNKSTSLFADKKYQEGLQQIQKCINYCPKNSLFYSNRGLFHVQQNQIQNAFSDLNQAISLNNLNYVAYFNLFSIYIRESKYQQALQNICCSLSVLYLLKGKQTKVIQDLDKSLQYANNNEEAKILKTCINLQKGNSKQTSEELISKQKKQQKKLQCSFKFQENQDFEQLINQKIQQFNKVYQIVSNFQGIKTKKIKAVNKQQNQTYLTQKYNSLKTQQIDFSKKETPFLSVAGDTFENSKQSQVQNISKLNSLDINKQHIKIIIIDGLTGEIVSQ